MGMCLSIMFGTMALLMGVIFTFVFPNFDPIFEILSSVLFFGGILLLIIGILLYPSIRRNTAIIRSILEIAAVRKEVTISEISQETGLDREFVRKIITQYLVSGFLFGYLEDDLFVRDTAGSRRFFGGPMGLSGVSG